MKTLARVYYPKTAYAQRVHFLVVASLASALVVGGWNVARELERIDNHGPYSLVAEILHDGKVMRYAIESNMTQQNCLTALQYSWVSASCRVQE